MFTGLGTSTGRQILDALSGPNIFHSYSLLQFCLRIYQNVSSLPDLLQYNLQIMERKNRIWVSMSLFHVSVIL